jgi:hypothetical protein
MKFELLTLVDITETRARFNKHNKDWQQQQNYITTLQTLGLRVNPEIDKLSIDLRDIKNIGFGKKYKGECKVWKLNFHIEYEDAVDIEMLENDFDYVPIITNLDETIDIKNKMFQTKDADYKNILFKYVD